MRWYELHLFCVIVWMMDTIQLLNIVCQKCIGIRVENCGEYFNTRVSKKYILLCRAVYFTCFFKTPEYPYEYRMSIICPENTSYIIHKIF